MNEHQKVFYFNYGKASHHFSSLNPLVCLSDNIEVSMSWLVRSPVNQAPCEIKSQNDLFSFCIQWWKWASIGIYPSVGFRKVRVSHCLVLMGWEIITSLNNSIKRANVSRERYRRAMGRLGGRIDNLCEVIISALWTVWRWRAVM